MKDATKHVKQTAFLDLSYHAGSNRTVGMADCGNSKYWETSNSTVCCPSLQKTWFNISVRITKLVTRLE